MKQKGFSLVELIIVIAIFVIITSVVLYNQNRFSSDISISNITYQVALQIRQAQVYGTLVRQGTGVPDTFNLGYGVNFFKSSDSAIGFSIFADGDTSVVTNGVYGNGSYQDGGQDSIVNTFNLSEGNIISEVCVHSSAGDVECMRKDDIDQVDIVFRRPEPNALISGGTITNGQYTEITISSALRDKEKLITVRNTGQISVTNVVE